MRYSRMINAASESGGAPEWAASRSILAYGVRLGVRTNRPEAVDRLSEHFPPLWKAISACNVKRAFSIKFGGDELTNTRGAVHELFEDQEPGTKSRSLAKLLEDLERRMKMYVAEMAPRRVFVHAGVVGWKGQAIVIPGRSLTGKTSLVEMLVRAGATYYSDEYAVLDMTGRVHAYPQSLQIRTPGTSRQKKVRAEEIGGTIGIKPLPVGLVVVSPYKAGGRWKPVQLSAGQAVLELLAHTLPARRKPEVVVRTLGKAVWESITLKGVRGEAEEAAKLILEGYETGRFGSKTGSPLIK